LAAGSSGTGGFSFAAVNKSGQGLAPGPAPKQPDRAGQRRQNLIPFQEYDAAKLKVEESAGMSRQWRPADRPGVFTMPALT
jgi:hypothetical protein